MELTQNYLKELFNYNEVTGSLIWAAGRKNAGRNAGTLRSNGYIQININGKIYLAHRLIWLYMHGTMPEDQIDHINHIRHDNRLINLREASCLQNNWNQSIKSNNTSTFKGVDFHNRSQKWSARIRVGNERIYLGLFETPELASKSYIMAANKYHKEYANIH